MHAEPVPATQFDSRAIPAIPAVRNASGTVSATGGVPASCTVPASIVNQPAGGSSRRLEALCFPVRRCCRAASAAEAAWRRW